MNDAPITWNDQQGVPEGYHALYYYKTDTIFGIVYGDLNFAITALENGVSVETIFNRI